MSLLLTLASQGLSVQADGSVLVLSPRDKLTDALRAQIRSHKPALLASLTRLRRYAADDEEWQQIVSDPPQFEGYISSVVTFEQRQRGEIPSHYTATVHCQNCNQDVPHYPVGDDTVGACVWCLNGQPVPTRQATS